MKKKGGGGRGESLVIKLTEKNEALNVANMAYNHYYIPEILSMKRM